jgi:hypothetical protein
VTAATRTMLRLLVVLLLAANGAFIAWSQGWLDAVTGPHDEREPARLAEQVRPDDVKLLPPRAASAVLAAADAAGTPVCLEAGPFAGAELEAAERQLTALPPGSWTRVASRTTGSLLRVERADPVLRAQLEALSAGFVPCATRQ